MLFTIHTHTHNVGVCVWIFIKGYTKFNHYSNLRFFLVGSKNCLPTLILFIPFQIFNVRHYILACVLLTCAGFSLGKMYSTLTRPMTCCSRHRVAAQDRRVTPHVSVECYCLGFCERFSSSLNNVFIPFFGLPRSALHLTNIITCRMI